MTAESDFLRSMRGEVGDLVADECERIAEMIDRQDQLIASFSGALTAAVGVITEWTRVGVAALNGDFCKGDKS